VALRINQFQSNLILLACSDLILGTFATWNQLDKMVAVTASAVPSSIADHPYPEQLGILAVAFAGRPFREVDPLALPFIAPLLKELALAEVEHHLGRGPGSRRDSGWQLPLIGVPDLVVRQSYLEFYLL
jgi:hypothetical protein